VLKSERGRSETTAADEAASRPARWRAAGPRLLWAAALVVAGVALFWCFLLESRTQAGNSDSAGMVLQGWEMFHGNPLLRGWFLSDVTFYTFEVPLDGLVAIVRGYNADAVHIAAALVYTLLVLSAALLAKGRARGREGVVRALLAAGILVAPALVPGAHVLLLAPDHTGIGVPVLLTLLFVDRAPQRWWAPVAACVLLTWAQVDDPIASVACAAPLAIVCAVRAGATLAVRLRRGRRARKTPESAAVLPPVPWYDAALAVAAVASYGLTREVLSAIESAGGFYVHGVAGGTGLAPWSAIPRQLQWTGQNLLYLFGGNYFGVTQPGAALGYLHAGSAPKARRPAGRAPRAGLAGGRTASPRRWSSAYSRCWRPARSAPTWPRSRARTRSRSCSRSARPSPAAWSAPGWPAPFPAVPPKGAAAAPPASWRRRCSPSPGWDTSARSATTPPGRPSRRKRKVSPTGSSSTI